MKGQGIDYGFVTLRPIEVVDAVTLIDIYDGKAGARFAFFEDELTLDRETAYISRMVESPSDLLWVVMVDGRIIGTVGLHEVDFHIGTARLGIMIWNSRFHGQGYGKKILYSLFRHAFEELGLEKIYTTTLVTNERAQKLYEKFGFKTEGVLQGEYKTKAGRKDMIRQGLVIADWEPNKILLEFRK